MSRSPVPLQSRPRVTLPRPLGHLSVAGVIAGPPGSNRAVLQGVTFGLAPGDGIGVLGPSASGKSTLARLVVGLWKPMAGSVRLDGATLDQWNPDLLGRHIGYLPQDVELIGGTVRDCISRHAPDATDEKVIAAARAPPPPRPDPPPAAGLHDAARRAGRRCPAASASASRSPARSTTTRRSSCSTSRTPTSTRTATRRSPRPSTPRERGAAVVVITHRPSALAAVDRILILKDGRPGRLRAEGRGAPRPHAEQTPPRR